MSGLILYCVVISTKLEFCCEPVTCMWGRVISKAIPITNDNISVFRITLYVILRLGTVDKPVHTDIKHQSKLSD